MVLPNGTVQTQNIIPISEGAPRQIDRVEKPDPGCFRQNDLLTGISEESYARVTEKIDILHYGPDQVIFEENDPGDSLYLIAQGAVKISKKGRGGQQETLAHLLKHDFFGEMALVDSGKRSAQAAAVGSVVVGRIDRTGWDLLLRLAPHEVLGNFTRAVTKRLRHNNQHFIEEVMRNERLSLIGTTISSIVHDMNNPISCILGACDIIRGTNQDKLTAEMAGLIRDAVKKMDTMTRELIDFSRGKTQLDLQSVNVSDLLHELEPDFRKCRPMIDVRVRTAYEGEVKVDRYRLLRVFGNLIRNAVEAMKQSERKTLVLSAKRVDSRVHFEISDTGCGIPPQLLPRIFEPFVTHGKTNGTGLGLAISKSVIEAHHGSIGVTSSDRGTTFTVELPLEA